MTSAQAVSIDSVAQTLPGPWQPRDLEMYARGLSTRDIGDAFRGPDGELLLSRSAVSEITDRCGRTTRGSAPGPEREPGSKVPERYRGHLGLGRPSGGGRESRVLERSEPPAHAGANAVSPDTKLHVAQTKWDRYRTLRVPPTSPTSTDDAYVVTCRAIPRNARRAGPRSRDEPGARPRDNAGATSAHDPQDMASDPLREEGGAVRGTYSSYASGRP
jgi:hypothetical protein